MTALMIVIMNVRDEAWMREYFKSVPDILADYGGRSVAASRAPDLLTGQGLAPDRVAILTFPSLDAIHQFWADERYQEFKSAREAGSDAEILIFENAVVDGGLH